jgi:hypothetical protein
MLLSAWTLAVGWVAQPHAVHRLHGAATAPMRLEDIICGLTQVVTDIDDTVKSSGGLAIAGIALGGVDVSYTRNSFYPGVFQFGLELSSATAKPRDPPNKMAVLTARAKEFKWALEIKQSSKLCTRFRLAGEAESVPDWGVGEVLYGSVAEWICQQRKGWRKFENFKILHKGLKPRTRYIFIGDNGKSEKDLEAATRIIDAFPKEMQGVFLHAVSGEEQPAPQPEDYDYGGGASLSLLRLRVACATLAAPFARRYFSPPLVRGSAGDALSHVRHRRDQGPRQEADRRAGGAPRAPPRPWGRPDSSPPPLPLPRARSAAHALSWLA